MSPIRTPSPPSLSSTTWTSPGALWRMAEPNAGVKSHPNQIVDAINVAVSARFFAVFAPMGSFRNRAIVYVDEGL